MINTRLLYLCTQQLYLLLLQLQLLPDMGESSKNSLMECSRSRPIIKYDDTGSWANVDDFLNSTAFIKDKRQGIWVCIDLQP
ncbi:hypothetical protein Tco_1100870, partial [Tanacetum coccineum]